MRGISPLSDRGWGEVECIDSGDVLEGLIV
jgi:hypothetical protein